MSRFTGKVAIITGSSNGIGRATALLFALEGAKVTVTGRNEARLRETKQQILESGVPEDHVLTVLADLSTDAGQDDLITSTITKFGKLDILVNNAGAAFNDAQGQVGVSQDISVYDKILQINLRSVVTLTQKAKEHLIASKGEVINVSSIAAGPQSVSYFLSPPYHSYQSHSYIYYGMSKAALDQFTRSASIDLIQFGVRVNSVSPGGVRTGFGDAMGMPDKMMDKMIAHLEAHKECLPSRKIGEPMDIAYIIAFLADRKHSSYIIGQSIVADGGSTLIMGMNTHDISLSSK